MVAINGGVMRVLVACEESQMVTTSFREREVEAFSCDLAPCSSEHPEWHLQCDVREILGEEWDLIVAFPPCTHLACSGARHFAKKRANGQQAQGIEFFMLFTRVECQHVAIENPIGIMSKHYREPDQIIQPWQFGDEATKSTCLWLKGLPLLVPTKLVGRGEMLTFGIEGCETMMPKWYADAASSGNRSQIRSKTFPGVAEAMAEQWSGYLRKPYYDPLLFPKKKSEQGNFSLGFR
jgi:hypothetical protein